MSLTNEEKNKLFTYFVTIFNVYYISWFRDQKRSKFLRCRTNALISKLEILLPIGKLEIRAIENNAKLAAKAYKKCLKVITETNEKSANNSWSLVINASNGKQLICGVNDEINWDLEYMIDEKSVFDLTVQLFHNQSHIKMQFVVKDTDISGFLGFTKNISIDKFRLKLTFEWILNENSCRQLMIEPLLVAKHFSTVMLALDEYWHIYRIPFQVLSQSQDITVKRVIFSSLSQMALILRPSQKVKYLVPVFENYYKDQEILVQNQSFFQNCVVFFNHLQPSVQLEVLSHVKPQLRHTTSETQRLKVAIIKKLMDKVCDYSVDQINGHLIEFIMHLFETKTSQHDIQMVLKLFVLCLKRLFPKDLSVDSEQVVNHQMMFLSELFNRFGINTSEQDMALMTNICSKLLEEDILSDQSLH